MGYSPKQVHSVTAVSTISSNTTKLLTNSQIVKCNQSRRKLTIQEIVRGIDGPHARVRIVVGVHAEAERPRGPQRRRLPVIVVVLEAVHAFRGAVLLHLRPLALLPQFLPHSFSFDSASLFAGGFSRIRPVGFLLGFTVTILLGARVVVNCRSFGGEFGLRSEQMVRTI